MFFYCSTYKTFTSILVIEIDFRRRGHHVQRVKGKSPLCQQTVPPTSHLTDVKNAHEPLNKNTLFYRFISLAKRRKFHDTQLN